MFNALQSQTYLSTEEAADLLGLTDVRIRQMLRAEEIGGEKIGRRSWAIPSSEIDRVKRQRANESGHKTTPAD